MKKKSKASAKKQQPRHPHRKFVVFTSLVGVLTVTSALLLALAPAPLQPDIANSLFAIDAPRSLDVIFDTKRPVTPGRWQYVYVHHSRTPAGDAQSLAGEAGGGLGDHFLIGNGDGAVDGEIQISQRWNQQLSAAAPAGASAIDPACISICLVGDFDQTTPSPTQVRRLQQLVQTLQGQLHVGAESVLLLDQPKSSAGIGRYFPQAAFRGQLLR